MKVLCSQEVVSSYRCGSSHVRSLRRRLRLRCPGLSSAGGSGKAFGRIRHVPNPLICMRFHGVLLGNQHEIWSKQHNRKVRGIRGRVADVHFGVATLHDLVGVTAGAKHRNASHVALLLKKASAWLGEWSSAHLQHDPFIGKKALSATASALSLLIAINSIAPETIRGKTITDAERCALSYSGDPVAYG
jgi:hypothetical protein